MALLAGCFKALQSLSLYASRRHLVVLDSSRFQRILADGGSTSWAYASDSLDKISFAKRGLMLETLARDMLERAHPGGLCENADALYLRKCINGRGRHLAQAAWDWIFMGRRVELKTAQLCCNAQAMTWRVTFFSVKLPIDGVRALQPFDDLYLLIYAPDGFYLIKHDLKTGVSTNGVRTASHGHVISVSGRRRQTWQESLERILWKLTSHGGCELVSYAANSDPLAQALYARLAVKAADPEQQAYQGIPLSSMNHILRALKIQHIAYELDRFQNPKSEFKSAGGEMTSGGYKRGASTAAVDWLRDGVRVEVKSAKLTFRKGSWMCCFCNIKEGLALKGTSVYFDELWLAIFSPCGLDFFRHLNWQAKLHNVGQRTAVNGKSLTIDAGRQEQSPCKALSCIKRKLAADGAELLFTVQWAAS